MEIIELTEEQFRMYSRLHSKKNFKQTIEYAKIKEENGYTPLYIALIDEYEDVHAASLILVKKLNNKHKYGFVPNGFLLDYFNIELLKSFTIELKTYLKKNNFVYIRLNPVLEYQIYDSDFILKENNSDIINEFKNLGYDFIPNNTKYKMLLKAKEIGYTYKNFKRSLRRNINDCLKKGIIVYKGSDADFDDFINLIDNKDRYIKMREFYTDKNNRFEFFIAKLDTETFINNYRYLIKKEQIINESLNEKLKNPYVRKTKKLMEKKMNSDHLLNVYNKCLADGTVLFKKYPNGVIISGVAVIVSPHSVTFIKEAYTDEFKYIRSIPLVKWEIIKQKINEGIHKFDLGDIIIAKNQITKTGYNGMIIEYSNNFDLVINDVLYKLNGFAKKKN